MTRQSINYLVVQIGERAELGFHVHPHILRHSCGYYSPIAAMTPGSCKIT